MSYETYSWLRVLHIVGFVLWIGGLLGLLKLLRVHAQVEGAARDVLARAERKIAVLMDAGATFAMVAGFWIAFGRAPNAFKTGGWLHVKLTVVVLGILSIHGFARVKARKFRQGQVTPISHALMYVVLVAAVVAITLGANGTLLRK